MIVLGIDAGTHVGLAVLALDRGAFRHEWSSSGRWPMTALVSYVLSQHRPSLVVIEAPKGYGYSNARVANLLDAARIGGELAGIARSFGVEVIETHAQETRRALCGKGNASDKLVADVVRMRIHDWPKRSNCHARDAAIAAMFGALRVRLPKEIGGAP